MATKKFNSIAEITINDIHANEVLTFDKKASFVFAVIDTIYMNGEADGHQNVEGLYLNEWDALQYMLNRMNCKAEKDAPQDIVIYDGCQVEYHYTAWKDMEFRHVWKVNKWPVHHSL